MLPAPLWLALVRAMLVVDDGTRIKPLSLHGEGKEEAASSQKRKPTPPRCARQPLPREGARVVIPSFLWKEVPRRGGGWVGKAVSPTQSLPRWGRQRGGGFAAKKEANPASLRSAAPSPRETGRVWTLPPSYGRRCPEGAEVGWGKRDPCNKAFPSWGRWRAKRAG